MAYNSNKGTQNFGDIHYDGLEFQLVPLVPPAPPPRFSLITEVHLLVRVP